jgi:hypothetical protein
LPLTQVVERIEFDNRDNLSDVTGIATGSPIWTA